jgi:diphosphomevalonate decarboxylase
MPTWNATARALSNIALIKYWGNINDDLRLPANGSLSIGLDGLSTTTTVEFSQELTQDNVVIGGQTVSGEAAARVSHHLDHVRRLAGVSYAANVTSANNFPTGVGIASSASAFAALSVAATAALGLNLSERELSALARLGSGSASRSIPGGFVEWYAAERHEDSYAETFAPADYWPLMDLIAIVSRVHKTTGSTEGHALAASSPYQQARVASAPQRIAVCKSAVLARDFDALATVVEHDSTMMHAVMMTGNPAVFYWQPPTLAIMASVREWRAAGLPVCYTIDAGANVHCLCLREYAETITAKLREIPGVEDVLHALPGGAAHVI